MAVQRYSYRSAGFQDGTWEEYRYDALGRRVFTRARREPSTTYDATVSGPLSVSSTVPVCRSFTERVWWDGDQSLVEKRTAEGTSDVSNSGLLGNIHALTLDEPLAVVTPGTSETRIINYNWRGQGMGSVYPDGAGADVSTGNAVAEIDWPAATQAQTYFTPSLDAPATDNNPKKWLGTFVQNGQGTTGMLYRRNRYFDTNTGRFTQEDPIGIAGGVNAYGFAGGDPVNFSDPFGLKVCYSGLGLDVQTLKQGTEDATNTRIALDKENCVSSFYARQGKGFEEIQSRFGRLVGDDDTYSVRYGAKGEGYYSHFDPSTRTAVLLRTDADRFRYGTGNWFTCNLLGGIDSAPLTIGGLIAHELVGHGGGAGEISSRKIENQYHRARGQPTRCLGGN